MTKNPRLKIKGEKHLLSLVERGRISIGHASQLLNTSIQDMHRLAEKHGVRLGATIEQQKKSGETLKKLAKK